MAKSSAKLKIAKQTKSKAKHRPAYGPPHGDAREASGPLQALVTPRSACSLVPIAQWFYATGAQFVEVGAQYRLAGVAGGLQPGADDVRQAIDPLGALGGWQIGDLQPGGFHGVHRGGG